MAGRGLQILAAAATVVLTACDHGEHCGAGATCVLLGNAEILSEVGSGLTVTAIDAGLYSVDFGQVVIGQTENGAVLLANSGPGDVTVFHQVTPADTEFS